MDPYLFHGNAARKRVETPREGDSRQGDFFAPKPPDTPIAAETMAVLYELAREVALKMGPRGAIVADVRQLAIRRGLEPKANTHDRSKSHYGRLMQDAGLVPKGVTRRVNTKEHPDLGHANGNDQRIWLHPDFAGSRPR